MVKKDYVESHVSNIPTCLAYVLDGLSPLAFLLCFLLLIASYHQSKKFKMVGAGPKYMYANNKNSTPLILPLGVGLSSNLT